jgi:hypothetical protein
MASSATSFLAETLNPGGGWGYGPGHGSNIEATAAVAVASAGDPAIAALHEGAVAWLQAAQNADGGWGFAKDDPQSGWMTAWAVLALAERGAGGVSEAVDRGAAWLLRTQALDPATSATAEELQQAKTLHGMDLTLRAWPWLPGQASFVEPSSMALWALMGVPSSPAIRARADQVVRYLVDRRCQPAGWNVGNPMMFSRSFPPRACPTAWTLLALAQAAPEAIRPEDIVALRADMHLDGGALALAWGLCALHALGQEDVAAAARLATLQAPDGSWGSNPYFTAMALMAGTERS